MRRVTRVPLAALLAVGCTLGVGACRLLGSGAPPPPARGVVLVLAAGMGGIETSRLPTLERLASEGRGFGSAFAPDPDPQRARAAVIDAVAAALAALPSASDVAVAALGELGAPVESKRLAFTLPALFRQGGVAEAGAAARLEAWLRSQPRFLLLAAVGGAAGEAAGQPPPAALAGAFAPTLPRIALADLGFSDPPGGERPPAAWSEPARQRAEAAHLARALASDRELAALVALVERAAPEAAWVVVSDPPPDRGAHGLLERRDALFDATLRATLVVKARGLSRPGRAAAGLVSTLDAVPTALELLGMPRQAADGARSLMPLLASPSAAGRQEAVSSVPRRTGRLGRSLRSPRYRYTEWPDGSRELYDHDKDPGEHTNLAGDAEHAATLRDLQLELRSRASHDAASVAPTPRARPLTAAGPGTAGAPRARNVVLIVVDDLNTRLGAWGAPVKTPAIDRLAARGVRFERAYAQVAMCNPSRVSMLTGWSPERTGVWQNEDPPRPAGVVPLQELVAAHGAVAAGIGKIYHSPADFRWSLAETELGEPEEHPDVDAAPARAAASGLFTPAAGDDRDQPDGQRARRAVTLVERGGARPFFLALGLVRPHRRWIAPARYFDLYPPDQVVLAPYPPDDLADVPAIAVKTLPQPLPGLTLLGREPPALVRDDALRRQAIAAYQACVSFADAQVGLVLDALDRRDRWKDTLVVLVGDNGFHLGEHGGLLRKDTLFEEALRVPLVVAAPGLPRPGAVVRTPVELLDVYPTIVDLLGLPAPGELDGRSLVPLLRDPDAAGRGYARSWRRVQPPERGYSLRTERLRYTLWPDGSEELYERRSRAAESENLASRPEWAGEKARLRARLEALVAGPPGGR